MKIQNVYYNRVSNSKQNAGINNMNSVSNIGVKPIVFGLTPITAKELQRGEKILEESLSLLSKSKESTRPTINYDGSVLDFLFIGDTLIRVKKVSREFSEYFDFYHGQLKNYLKRGIEHFEKFGFEEGRLTEASTKK